MQVWQEGLNRLKNPAASWTENVSTTLSVTPQGRAKLKIPECKVRSVSSLAWPQRILYRMHPRRNASLCAGRCAVYQDGQDFGGAWKQLFEDSADAQHTEECASDSGVHWRISGRAGVCTGSGRSHHTKPFCRRNRDMLPASSAVAGLPSLLPEVRLGPETSKRTEISVET